MEDTKNKIESEQHNLSLLNNIKEEILYIIPNRINNRIKQTAKEVFALGAIAIIFGGFFTGWLLMDNYLKGLQLFLQLSLPISSVCFLCKSFSDTSSDRKKLKDLKKRYDLNQIECEIFKCKGKIKELERELFRIQHTIQNGKIESSHYTRKPQQIDYYYEDSYTSGRSR